MKILVNKENIKKIGKNIVLGTLVAGSLLVPGCASSNSYLNGQEESNITYETGEHMLLEVKRSMALMGKSGRYSLTAPTGYRIMDYDYDFFIGDDSLDFHFDDFVYVNIEPVIASNSNNIGEPINEITGENNESNILEPYQHVLANIDKSLTLLGKFNETFTLESPVGYTILDYDYDIAGNFDYENITYTNVVPVKLENEKDFGMPTENLTSNIHSNGFYDAGEHFVVQINRNLNLFLGKDGFRQIEAPAGYRVVDYDYDKTDNTEFETITYCNEVPVIALEDEFGNPVDEVKVNTHEDGVYEAGEHVLVRIDRNFDFWFGYNGTRQLTTPDGYEILDYDYDKNENFEFETYVYTNNKKISVSDASTFGTVIEQEESVTKKLVP